MARILGTISSGFTEVGSFESIATLTGVGDFTSIPQTYSHLQLRCVGRTNINGTSTNINFRLNGDTGNTLVSHYIYTDGSSVTPGYGAADNQILGVRVPGTSGTNNIGCAIIDILDYTNTNKYKTIRLLTGHNNNGSGYWFLESALWMSTSAVSSINLIVNGGNVAGSCSFALYGIKGS